MKYQVNVMNEQDDQEALVLHFAVEKGKSMADSAMMMIVEEMLNQGKVV